MPVLTALREEAILPSVVRGPVDFSELRRLAASFCRDNIFGSSLERVQQVGGGELVNSFRINEKSL